MPLVDPVTMSSSISKSAAAQAQSLVKGSTAASSSAASKDTTILISTHEQQPIALRQTPLSQSARHIFPALLATGFLVRFNALVSDPVSTMKTALPVVVALQLGYAVVCLPVVGSQQGATAVRKPRPGEKKGGKKSGGDGAGGRIVVVSLFRKYPMFALGRSGARVLFGTNYYSGANLFLILNRHRSSRFF